MTITHNKIEKIDREKLVSDIEEMTPSGANAFVWRTVLDQLDLIIDVLNDFQTPKHTTTRKSPKDAPKVA